MRGWSTPLCPTTLVVVAGSGARASSFGVDSALARALATGRKETVAR